MARFVDIGCSSSMRGNEWSTIEERLAFSRKSEPVTWYSGGVVATTLPRSTRDWV